MPLPHDSFDLQSALHPSPDLPFPSSQISPASTKPLPHPVPRQIPSKQAAVEVVLIAQESPSTCPSQAFSCSGKTQPAISATQTVPAAQTRSPHWTVVEPTQPAASAATRAGSTRTG